MLVMIMEAIPMLAYTEISHAKYNRRTLTVFKKKLWVFIKTFCILKEFLILKLFLYYQLLNQIYF